MRVAIFAGLFLLSGCATHRDLQRETRNRKEQDRLIAQAFRAALVVLKSHEERLAYLEYRLRPNGPDGLAEDPEGAEKDEAVRQKLHDASRKPVIWDDTAPEPFPEAVENPK